jgi:hypothetical protein
MENNAINAEEPRAYPTAMVSPPKADDTVHIVRAERGGSFSSLTLPADALAQLETAFRKAPWWRDGWNDPGFRAVALGIMQESGGLVFIGRRVKLELADPYNEFFEPIKICRTLPYSDTRLKTITGDAPMEDERAQAIFQAIAIGFPFTIAFLWIGGFFLGLSQELINFAGFITTVVAMVFYFAVFLGPGLGRYYLVPGGIVIVRRSIWPWRPPKINMFSRHDTCVAFRVIIIGGLITFGIDLWTHDGKFARHCIRERDAVSIIAVWQGTQEPLDDVRLKDFAASH